jgi:hypothetical protein
VGWDVKVKEGGFERHGMTAKSVVMSTRSGAGLNDCHLTCLLQLRGRHEGGTSDLGHLHRRKVVWVIHAGGARRRHSAAQYVSIDHFDFSVA